VQKVDDEFQRRFIVVAKDYLKETGLGLGIAHGIISVICCCGVSLWIAINLERNKNIVTRADV
jgi:hypothetical protein